MEINKRKSDVFEVGTVVEVERRERKWFKKAMPGNGGAGKVVKVVQDEIGSVTYNVKYFINGSEKGVLPQHMSRPIDLAKREVAEREFLQPGDYENERAAARAVQRVRDLEAVAKRRALKAASSTSNSQRTEPDSTFIYPAEAMAAQRKAAKEAAEKAAKDEAAKRAKKPCNVACSLTNYHNLGAFEVTFISADCDGCGGRYAKGSSFHGCRACNFDLCQACYTKATVAATAAAGPSGVAEPMSALHALAESAAGRPSLQSTDSGRNPRTSIDVGPMMEEPAASSDAATQTSFAASSEVRAVSDMACQTDFTTESTEATSPNAQNTGSQAEPSADASSSSSSTAAAALAGEKPRPAYSAKALFRKHHLPGVKQALGSSVSKMDYKTELDRMWESASAPERAKFDALAQADEERYQREVAASTDSTNAQESTNTTFTVVDLTSPAVKSAAKKKKKHKKKARAADVEDAATPDLAAWKAASAVAGTAASSSYNVGLSKTPACTASTTTNSDSAPPPPTVAARKASSMASPTSSAAVDLAAGASLPEQESGYLTPSTNDDDAPSGAPSATEDSAPPTVCLAPYPEPEVAAPTNPPPSPPPPVVNVAPNVAAPAANTINVEQAVTEAIFRLQETEGMDFDFEVLMAELVKVLPALPSEDEMCTILRALDVENIVMFSESPESRMIFVI